MTQDEQLAKAVGKFGQSAKEKLTSPAAIGEPEDQLRAPLEALLAALAAMIMPAADVTLIGETSLSDLKTRPDFSVTVDRALVGFIEVKAPGKGADPRRFKDPHDKAQWAKLQALPNLVYTDGNAFSLWRSGLLVGDIVRLSRDIETEGAGLGPAPGLLPLVHDFLSWHPVAPKNALDLALVSARLCRFLRDEVAEQMEAGSSPLHDLARDWRTLLFPHADNDQFADGYAQAVTFGLLMAKSLGLSVAGDLDAVARKLGESNTLIGTALRLLTEQPETVLAASLATMKRVLDVVDWAVISKGDPEAWLYFYERFLDVYDRRLRKLTGSYYTPPQVVQAMVRLCDEALKAPGRFAVHDGIANPQVHIADPAAGSGTFLLALIRHIADSIEADQGKGAVPAGVEAAARRLYGFELQFGAFAVAQLRLLAEMLSLGASGSPHLFVTDTLDDPYEHEESGTGLSRQLSRSRIAANKVKTSQPITLVIGNPPYKEKAKGRGGWVEQGSAFRRAPLLDWQPPRDWKVGAHAKHLRNLYIYFWRWAAWKVFEQGGGGRDKEPPEPEKLSGLICFITVAGFLNGPGFQKMRHDLRRDCDEIWVIDCSPEGHQPDVATRIFEGVQHPVCIVLASRSPASDPAVPARVRYRSLAPGIREQKFEELAVIGLGGDEWSDGPSQWRAPFLPEFTGGWADFIPLDGILGDAGSGVMPGRTWIIAPDRQSLEQRWGALVGEKDSARRALLFHPHEGGDRTVAKGSRAFPGHHEALASIEFGIGNRASKDPNAARLAAAALRLVRPVPYGFRSFDRQWIIPDYRLINRPNPALWQRHSDRQIYLSALMAHSPSSGPAVSATALVPDLHQYKGSFGGRVFSLWKDAAGTQANVDDALIVALAMRHGAAPEPGDIFAYVAALLASPAYTERFRGDLVRPGLRVPVTADRSLFDEAAATGREIIWLHSFGERFADLAHGRPAAPPRLPPERRPFVPEDGGIPTDPARMPDTIGYDPVRQRLKVGTGFIDNVPPAIWSYEVSGKQVLRQWFSYRKRRRERPQIGDKRPPSPLQAIQPDHWLPEYTAELLNVLNVLGLLVELEPKQADLLARVTEGPLVTPSMLA